MSKTTDPYQELCKAVIRRGVSPAVVRQLMKVAGRWIGVKR